MRTVSASTTVRLYYLDDGDPVAETLFYGSMADAIALARQQPEDVQSGLWLATDNDVVAFLDLDATYSNARGDFPAAGDRQSFT